VVIHYEEALYQVYAPLPLPLFSKLCTWNVGRTLVMLLEWCYRTPQFSGLSPAKRVIGLHVHHCIHIMRTYDADSDWHL